MAVKCNENDPDLFLVACVLKDQFQMGLEHLSKLQRRRRLLHNLRMLFRRLDNPASQAEIIDIMYD